MLPRAEPADCRCYKFLLTARLCLLDEPVYIPDIKVLPSADADTRQRPVPDQPSHAVRGNPEVVSNGLDIVQATG
jgi:hypothetical protein